MKINQIDIVNYKGFKDASVSFHPKINVFIGSNASGKTTLLSAITKAIFDFTHDFVEKVHPQNKLILSDDDINYEKSFSTINLNFDVLKEKKLNSFIATGFVPDDIGNESSNFNKRRFSYTRKLYEAMENPMTLPIIKFYPADRGNIDYNLDNPSRFYKISQLEAWENIYQSNISYSKFFHWFFENETNELRIQRDHRDFELQNPTLKDIRKALHETFKLIGYKNHKLVSKQINRKHNSKQYPTLVIQDLKTGEEEFIENKSDGEKAVILLVADIAYNLSLAKDFTTNNDFLKSPGVVLIDEIETHLHPKWQRKIIPILQKIFPNIQYFIATHSPQVVSSVQSESVFVCQNFNIQKINLKTYGEDTNSILNYIFEATDRPKEYVELIEKFDKLIDQNSDIDNLEKVILSIEKLYSKDKAHGISNLIEDLSIRLSAYKFDKEYEEN